MNFSKIYANNVSLLVGGLKYGGWESIQIKQGIEQLAGGFALALTDKWPGQAVSWAIEAGQSCTVKIDDDVMITGFVDSVKVRIDKGTHTINIEGRDATGDLVDCSAAPKEWQGMSFEQVATDLISPFGIELFTQLETGAAGYKPKKHGKGKHGGGGKAPSQKAFHGGGKLPRKSCNSGETVHRILEKLAKIQGVLLLSNRHGGLVVTRAGLNGRATDVLAYGQNIKSIDYERSFANLFSEITVKGQAHGATSTGGGGPVLINAETAKSVAIVTRPKVTAATQAGTTINNPEIHRYRPLIIMAEEQADAARCQRRAQWEAGTREARSKKLQIVVQGWRQTNGRLWEINTLVRIKCPFVRENDDFLVSNIEYKLDLQGGTVCDMTLFSPDAYDVLPDIPAPADGGKKRQTGPVKLLIGK